MNVDGTNNQTPAVTVPKKADRSALEVQRARQQTERESQLASAATPQDAARVTAKLHDSFEHIPTEAETPLTYADEYSGRGSERVISGAFEATREALDDAYTLDIVDLATAVSSEGLPLLPKTEESGVLKQDVLNAYQASKVPASRTATDHNPASPLDTLG